MRGRQFALRTGEAILREVAAHHGHHGLGFGVAEAAVELDHLRAVRREHDAKIQEAAIFQSVFLQTCDGGFDQFVFNAFQQG